jgi:hypothetical protein
MFFPFNLFAADGDIFWAFDSEHDLRARNPLDYQSNLAIGNVNLFTWFSGQPEHLFSPFDL